MRIPGRAALEYAFREYNAWLFRRRLPEIPIHRQRSRCYGEWVEPEGLEDTRRYPYGIIYLSSHPLAVQLWGGWRGILVHEMIHADLYFSGREMPGGGVHEDHDEVFHAQTVRVGRRLGLPPIDLEIAWSWPWGLTWDFKKLEGDYE